MKNEHLFEGLRFVVQYRSVRPGGLWKSMAAFDVEGPAVKYVDDCNERPCPWAYRAVDAETGLAVHEPEPKSEGEP